MDTATAAQYLANIWSESLDKIEESIDDMQDWSIEYISGITKEEHYAKNEAQEKVQPLDVGGTGIEILWGLSRICIPKPLSIKTLSW